MFINTKPVATAWVYVYFQLINHGSFRCLSPAGSSDPDLSLVTDKI